MSEPAAFEGFNNQLGSSLSGGKRKKGNGHKATCGCPICNNMRKKGKKGGVLLVGGALCPDGVTDDGGDPNSCPAVGSDDSSPSSMGGGRRRRSRSRSRSRSKSRSRSSRKSMKGGKKRKSKRRR